IRRAARRSPFAHRRVGRGAPAPPRTDPGAGVARHRALGHAAGLVSTGDRSPFGVVHARVMNKPLIRVLLVVALVLVATPVLAQARSSVDLKVDGVGSVSAPLQLVLLMTLISFLPAILVTMTSFTRIAIIFHFLRQALGTQEMPPNQVLIGLALFLTMFIMATVGEQVNKAAVQPALAGTVTVSEAMSLAAPPLRTFMLRQTREADLGLFIELGKTEKPESAEELPMTVVIPAYVISELKT